MIKGLGGGKPQAAPPETPPRWLLLSDSAAKTRFFSCFASGSCSLAKYTKLCMVWQQNVRICCEFSGGGLRPRTPPPPGALALGCRPPVPPISKSWLRYRLKNFSDSASHLGLNISWPKTKLQNIGSSPKPPDISVDGNTVESVDSFV